MNEFEKQKHFLMDVFKSQAYIPMKKKDLEILLDVPKDKRAEFAMVLDELVGQGQVEITKRGKYQIPENRPKFIKTKDHRSKKPTKAEQASKKQSLNAVAKKANQPKYDNI